MEVAHSTRFLNSAILFSLIYDNYERDLKRELWLCHQHMNLSMTELQNMPIRDRKFYIREHNKYIEQQKQDLKKLKK